MEANWTLVLDQAGGGARGLSEETLTKRGRSVGTPGEEDPLKSIEKAKCDKKKKETFEAELISFPLVGSRAELALGTGDRVSGQAFTRLKRPEAFLLRT